MDEKVHVGSDRPKKKWSVNKPIIIAAVIVALLIVGACVAWYFLKHRPNKDVSKTTSSAHELMRQGDYQKALDQLKDQAGKTNNKDQQAQIYDGLAAAASSQGKIAEALHYYDLKHQIAPDSVKADAYLMGTLYERSNDNKNAIAQFKIALDYYKTLPQTYTVQMNVQSVQAEIQALEKNP
jgi:tetratricopeptide (TPR) repeat protein